MGEAMEIRFTAVLTEPVYARLVKRQMRGLFLAGWYCLGIGVLALGYFVAGAEGSSLQNGGPNNAWGTGIVVALMLGAYLVWSPRASARRGWKGNPGLQDPAEWVVDETSVRVDSEFHKSHLPWEKFHHQIIDQDLILLYTQEHSAYLISRAYLADEAEWEQLKAWASAKIPQPPKKGWMLKAMLIWIAVLALVFLAIKYIPAE